MKIATILSVSALLALFSAVACSSSTTPAGNDKNNANGDDDDDDDDDSTGKPKTDAGSSSSSSGSAAGDDDDTTGDGPTAAQKACETCKVTKNAGYKAASDCGEKASSEAAFDKCFEDAGCGSGGADDVCAAAETACTTECKAADDEADAADQACLTCLKTQKNSDGAAAIVQCFIDAKDETDDDKCNDLDDKCDSACQAAFKGCDSKCGE